LPSIHSIPYLCSFCSLTFHALSEQVLVDAMQELNAALQPAQRATLKLAAFKPASVPP
jgi:hypothetical protein